MIKPTPQALAAAVNALYRIRAVEGSPGPDGKKTVWHQCALGAELVSSVDGQGHVVRQELTLLQGYFLWDKEQGLRTGVVEEEGPRALVNGGPVEVLDEQVHPERLAEALAALSEYSGEDRYIRHVLRALAAARYGQEEEEITVTSVESLDGAASRRRLSRRWLYAAVTLAAMALGAAVVMALLQ